MDVRDYVIPFYAKNDKAHQIDHADEVCELALEIANRIKYPHLNLVRLAAYLHDIKLYKGRKEHHTLSAIHVMSGSMDNVFGTTSINDRLKVSAACAEHRASYKGEFTSLLSEIISSADRGKPKGFEYMWNRVMNSKETLESDDPEAAAIQHLKDKFGRNGYARYPNLYKLYFAKELEEQFNMIDSL